jgi:glycosyltransferase involved in cell wall biosynthesis
VRNGIPYCFSPSPARPLVDRRLHADVVHVNGLVFRRQIWTLRRRLPADTALLVQDHGGQPDLRRSVASSARRALDRSALRDVDGFLFASGEQADPWRHSALIRPEQPVYAVMPASSDFRPIERERARATTGISGAPAILWVGHLDTNKDPLTVIAAFERSLQDLPDATLTMIYGGTALLPDVLRRIESSASLRARVRLAGCVEHARMAEFFSASDLFTVGSHHEGSGYALLEACACGCIPVVTDIPSFRAITGNGAIGSLWRIGDAGACARMIVDAAGGDRDRKRCAVLRHFEDALSWPVVGKRAVEIYEAAVSRRRSPASAPSCR